MSLYCDVQHYFSYIVSFCGGNQHTQRKPTTCSK